MNTMNDEESEEHRKFLAKTSKLGCDRCKELEKENEELKKSLLNIKGLLNITAPMTEQQETVFWSIKNIIRLKGLLNMRLRKY